MPTAEILTIGTELLLGEITDTNSQYLARQLRDAGIDIYWTTTVGDNLGRIAEGVQRALGRSDILICTGGLGPTIDDMTREGIAQALDIELELHDDLWQKIQERFASFGRKASENNRRQAYLPSGAVALENEAGTAPGFYLEHQDSVVISLPGVPGEMKHLWEKKVQPYLLHRFGQPFIIRSRVLHSAGVGESLIDERITDLEALSNPTVGLAAHAGSVDVRLTAKAESEEEAERMLADLEGQVRERLGDWIYGVDEETLPGKIMEALVRLGHTLALVEAGFNGGLGEPFAEAGTHFKGSQALETLPAIDELSTLARQQAKGQGADVALAARLNLQGDKLELDMQLHMPSGEKTHTYRYGGALQSAPAWAINLTLSWLLRQLNKGNS